MSDKSLSLTQIKNEDLIAIIGKLPHMAESDKSALIQKITLNDIELVRNGREKFLQSQVASHDLSFIMAEVAAISKKGMYIKAKQVVRTGSGQFEVEMRGGDSKLIVSVLSIIAIVLIALLAIMFWR